MNEDKNITETKINEPIKVVGVEAKVIKIFCGRNQKTRMIEINKIYNESNCDTMRRMGDDSVDLIITSPPYNVWRNKRTQARKKEYWERTNINYDKYHDKMSDEDYQKWQINLINEMIRILKPTGTLAYNNKDQIFNFRAASPIEWILKTNAVYRQRITWDRGGMQAFNNVRFYRNEEDIYILGKKAKGFTWDKNCAKYMSIWKITPERNIDHPAPFPEEIPKRCIEAFSNKGDIIYDPFMGSGTVAVVAARLNRNYVGSEISKKYCDIAERRLQPYKSNIDMFYEQAKNSL